MKTKFGIVGCGFLGGIVAQSEAEGILNRLLPADITQNDIPPVRSF